MPEFAYTARTKEGVVEKDVLVGVNSKAIADALRARGMMPISIRPAGKSLNMDNLNEYFARVKMIDKITFINNLSVMIKSGLPVSRALKILIQQTTNPKLAKIISNIHNQVEAGTSLAD